MNESLWTISQALDHRAWHIGCEFDLTPIEIARLDRMIRAGKPAYISVKAILAYRDNLAYLLLS